MFRTTVFILIIVLAVETDSQAPINECLVWYEMQGDPNLILRQTQKPPCKIPVPFPLELRGGWVMDPECNPIMLGPQCRQNANANGCYLHSYAKIGPGGQACYDWKGDWISDSWKGAGTVDAETPLGRADQVARHYAADVRPFLLCCKNINIPQPQSCQRFYDKRPPGQCENKTAV